MEISFLKNPKFVSTLFYLYCKDYVLKHERFIKDYLLIFFMFQYFWSYLGTFYYLQDIIYYINTNIYISTYWLFLGILSSIGLGSGVNTGLLFLFPFITKITLTAVYCGHTNFHIYGENEFQCEKIDAQPSLFMIFLKVIYCVLCWGVGTAIGEIPPYYIARNTRLSGKTIDLSYINQSNIMKYINEKMIIFIKKHGFYTVLFFASWPNMLFDACGIACGYCLISFQEFFSATLIGKAFIKSPAQALFLIYMIIQALNNESLEFLPEILRNFIKSLTEREKGKSINESYINVDINNNISNINNIDNLLNKNDISGITIHSLIYYIWNFIVMSIFLYFIKNLIETVAQSQYEKLNIKTNKKQEENQEENLESQENVNQEENLENQEETLESQEKVNQEENLEENLENQTIELKKEN